MTFFRTLLSASVFALASASAVAAPIFSDTFSDSPATSLAVAPNSTNTAVSLLNLGSVQRTIRIYNDAVSADDITAKANFGGTPSGLLSISKPAGVVGTIELEYAGSAFASLTSLTASVTFDLRSLDIGGMDVRLFVGGLERDAVLDLPSELFAPPPLPVTLTYAGDWSSGFTVKFEPLEDSDFRIDNLALVPAPATLALLGLGLIGVAGLVRRRV